MKWFAVIGAVFGLAGAASFAHGQSVLGNVRPSTVLVTNSPPTPTEIPPGYSLLVLHSKGGSIAVVSPLSERDCNYWAQRLTPPIGTNIENYTIVSGTCYR